MKRAWTSAVFQVTMLITALLFVFPDSALCAGPKVRPAYNAGGFYPADRKELAKMLDDLLARVTAEKLGGPLIALVAPHAGYEYSGHVAAHAYSLLKGSKLVRVVVISPCHVEAFPFNSVYEGDAYATPLGNIPVDKEFAKRLAGLNPLIKLSDRGHAEVAGRGEHSLEVQLPFLQRVLGEFKLVPVVMGDQTYEMSRALGVSLAKLIQGQTPAAAGSPRQADTLIVASSDLSHFHPYDDAVRLDRKVLNAIEEWDYFNLSNNLERRVWEACGGGPIVAAMIAAERLGANRAKVLKYANSGDVTADRSRVVGYGAVALVAETGKRSGKAREFSLSLAEREQLLSIAKESVQTAVREGQLYQCSAGGHAALQQDRGAFVTLKKKGQLRGCIGYVAPTKPLCQTVRDVAALAALKDERFNPVTISELGELEYEISVLSPLRRVTDIKQIHVGKHGLVVKKGEYEGLLLPQVATEQSWDRKTFLEQTCVKAGLPPHTWQDEDADVFLFSAVVFGEPLGPEPVTFEEPAFPKPRGLPGSPGPGSPRP